MVAEVKFTSPLCEFMVAGIFAALKLLSGVGLVNENPATYGMITGVAGGLKVVTISERGSAKENTNESRSGSNAVKLKRIFSPAQTTVGGEIENLGELSKQGEVFVALFSYINDRIVIPNAPGVCKLSILKFLEKSSQVKAHPFAGGIPTIEISSF